MNKPTHHLYCWTDGAPLGHPDKVLGRMISIDQTPRDWEDLTLEFRLMVQSIHNTAPDVPLTAIHTEVFIDE
jgi:hypothetical protein